jgi:hypothetical protein
MLSSNFLTGGRPPARRMRCDSARRPIGIANTMYAAAGISLVGLVVALLMAPETGSWICTRRDPWTRTPPRADKAHPRGDETGCQLLDTVRST